MKRTENVWLRIPRRNPEVARYINAYAPVMLIERNTETVIASVVREEILAVTDLTPETLIKQVWGGAVKEG